MCDHEWGKCPGRSCQCPCMDCLMGDTEPVSAAPSSVRFTYPERDGRHRTVHAENRRTDETLGSYNFEHQEGWTPDGANFTGPGAYNHWTAATKKLATPKAR